ncbi:hypothetical protein BBI15_09190 [Planococcus plakortidis]|uniref:Uncharacterized protein n=1 Tax=Planococcus plakortidis TaxID=1038856 RepID=A0A1C7EAB3_9BACL|nr:hypothetical protein BBI15_09190 [Planococcus plakortidis]
MGIQNLPQKSFYPVFSTLFLKNATKEKGSSFHYTQNAGSWHARAIESEPSPNAEFSGREEE